jgi:hypothetical protein
MKRHDSSNEFELFLFRANPAIIVVAVPPMFLYPLVLTGAAQLVPKRPDPLPIGNQLLPMIPSHLLGTNEDE